jgi:hypothetical protein
LIAPSPRHRWPLAEQLGLTVDDFLEDDTAIIARAIAAGWEHGREVCAKVSRALLREADLWTEADERRFVTGGLRWGPGPLAVLFSRMSDLDDEAGQIAEAIDAVRRLPEGVVS